MFRKGRSARSKTLIYNIQQMHWIAELKMLESRMVTWFVVRFRY